MADRVDPLVERTHHGQGSRLDGPPEDPDAFERYYADTHTALAQKDPGPAAVRGRSGLRDAGRQPAPYQRIAELTFDDMSALQAGLRIRGGAGGRQRHPELRHRRRHDLLRRDRLTPSRATWLRSVRRHGLPAPCPQARAQNVVEGRAVDRPWNPLRHPNVMWPWCGAATLWPASSARCAVAIGVPVPDLVPLSPAERSRPGPHSTIAALFDAPGLALFARICDSELTLGDDACASSFGSATWKPTETVARNPMARASASIAG